MDFSERLNNRFKTVADYDGTPVTIEIEKFVKGAEKDIVPNETGESYFKMVESSGGEPHNHYFKDGQEQLVHNIAFTLNSPKKGAINIVNNEEGYIHRISF